MKQFLSEFPMIAKKPWSQVLKAETQLYTMVPAGAESKKIRRDPNSSEMSWVHMSPEVERAFLGIYSEMK